MYTTLAASGGDCAFFVGREGGRPQAVQTMALDGSRLCAEVARSRDVTTQWRGAEEEALRENRAALVEEISWCRRRRWRREAAVYDRRVGGSWLVPSARGGVVSRLGLEESRLQSGAVGA